MAAKRRRAGRVRRFWRDESGQSSFFAALTLFLLVAAIGYSYNVGMVVSKRVRLQNAADAAALSAAAVEANALSAIAWLNGCETYIHARMQEILLDIPYAATAAATAEWGRYVQDRYGTGDLKKNPVEMNHNTNKIGFVNGLVNQIKDLLNGLGGMFSNLDETDGGADSEAGKRLKELFEEYAAADTLDYRKKEIEEILLNDYGLDIRSSTTHEIKEFAETLNQAIKDLDAYISNYFTVANDFKSRDPSTSYSALCGRGEGNYNYEACIQDAIGAIKSCFSCGGASFHDEMIKIGNALGTELNKIHADDSETANIGPYENSYTDVNQKIEACLLAMESRRSVIAEYLNDDDNNKDDDNYKSHEAEDNVILNCMKELNALLEKGKELQEKVDAIVSKLEEIDELLKDSPDISGSNTISPDQTATEVNYQNLLDEWTNNRQTTELEYSTERSMILNSYYDPPEPWALLKMVPIPLFNPYGPNMNIGRMTPLGTALSEVGIGGEKYPEESEIKRDENLDDLIKAWSNEKTLAQGLPPWEELKTALAGPLGKYVWPDLMRIRYSLDSSVDSMDGFLDFFHNTLVKQAEKWVGYRDQSSGKGIRPGEQWIRQLSQISAAIASALPRLVRNEVVYSLAVNGSPTTSDAIFPDPDDAEKWGDVAFARTDAQADEKFFRYDGWFSPPVDPTLNRNWMPPPPYVNMYTLFNSLAPSVNDAVTFNNPAVWTEDEQLYANRFLNESRRQNMRMRTITLAEMGAEMLAGKIKDELSSMNSKIPDIVDTFVDMQSLVHGIFDHATEVFPIFKSPFPSLSYATLVDENDATGNSGEKRRYFRMNYDKSFYWDEYAGRVGGWPETDGPGAPVRIAVKCWNQNDRLWRQPKTDAKNNNKMLLGLFDGLANFLTIIPAPLPVPYASSHYSFNNGLRNMASKTQMNFNLCPRCQTGYAPGSNVFGLGHALFVPCHGDPNDAFGAADGHWHYMHYHAHSHSCQVGFPGVGLCTAMVNCIFMGIIDWFIKGAIALGNDDGPFDRRVGWDATIHHPYKHWDGTVADDSSVMFVGDGEGSDEKKLDEYVEKAKKYHIFCAVSTSNAFSENYPVWNTISKILNHSEERQPPFTIPATTDISTAINQLVPPISLYAIVDPCPKIHIPIINITICQHFLNHIQNFTPGGMNAALHGHVTCDKNYKAIFPKDMTPLFNTPVLWNWGDMDPSIISMWGAFLTSGDMEGDPFMAFGSGDRFFYPEMFYRVTGAIGEWLGTDKGKYSTGRPRLFTKLNNPSDWAGEVVGIFGHAAGALANTNFLGNLTGDLPSVLADLFNAAGKLIGQSFSLDLGNQGVDTQHLASNADLYATGSVYHEVFTTIFDLMSRWGHHRFMTCPLCMSYCPLNCDSHGKEGGYPIRHWGGDYGGADTFDVMPGSGAEFGGAIGTYYKALGFLSIMPGLLATGDQKADAGMSYANVLRGHDYSPGQTAASNQYWYGRNGEDDKIGKIPYGNSYFDLGIDLDDGLAGNGPSSALSADGDPSDTGARAWSARFPTDRFVREWMSPVRKGSTVPDTTLAPTVIVTENFMRHAITVAVVEEYKPMLWMFGRKRPMMAVATAKCGFIERPDAYVGDELVVVDGLGVGKTAAPQIITGIGEPDGGVDNNNATGWNLDSLWENFLDFPNARPIGESNLYHGNWGAKMVPTRFAILANSKRDNTNARRSGVNQFPEPDEAHRSLWLQLGSSTCYRGDGVVFPGDGTLMERVGMTSGEWAVFAKGAVDTARTMERGMAW